MSQRPGRRPTHAQEFVACQHNRVPVKPEERRVVVPDVLRRGMSEPVPGVREGGVRAGVHGVVVAGLEGAEGGDPVQGEPLDVVRLGDEAAEATPDALD